MLVTGQLIALKHTVRDANAHLGPEREKSTAAESNKMVQ